MRSLLIISSVFYPYPHVSAVRMTEWARHLPEFGWKPTVLCRHYGYEADRSQLSDRVSRHVNVIYLNPPSRNSPGSSASVAAMFRRFAASCVPCVPDPAVLFWRRSCSRIVDIAKRINADCVLTSGPAHSIHVVGGAVKDRLNISWVADFRDPWMIDRRFQPKGFQRLLHPFHRRAEGLVYRQADLITHAIPLHHRHTRLRFPCTRDKSVLITNGAPNNLFDGSIKPIKSDSSTSIRVVGSPGSTKQLQMLADAIQPILDAELMLVGEVPSTVERLRLTLGNRLTTIGPVPHDQALRYILGADILVAVLSPERSASLGLSSKLFEYAATSCPIVILNPTRSDLRLIKPWKGVRSIQNDIKPADLAAAIKSLIADAPFLGRPVDSRRSQAETFARMLEQVPSRMVNSGR